MLARQISCLVALGIGITAPAAAQPTQSWTFRTRLAISGSSDHSNPAGFVTYSGVGLETALSRDLGPRLAVEAGLRLESREVDRERSAGGRDRLGSLELLPVTVVLQYHPGGGGLRPYLGAGGGVTFAWEKTGVLDSMDVTAHLGPVVQIGVDKDLGSAALLNLEVRWQTLSLPIESGGSRFARLRIHPLTLGAGLGFRF